MSKRPPVSNERRDWCIALAILAAACTVSIWLAYPNRIVPSPNAGLVVDGKDLDFGEVWEDSAFPWKFTIHNPTTQDIHIKEWYRTCNCASVEPKALAIGAGQKVDVRVLLDLTAVTERDQGIAVRNFDVEVLPLMEDATASALGWQLRGRVKRAIALEPRELTFDRCFDRGPAAPARRITIKTLMPATRIEAKGVLSFASWSLHRSEKNSELYYLDVRPAGCVAAGRRREKLVITAFDEKAKAKHDVVVPVTARVLTDIEPIPARVFGFGKLGQQISETITLRSRVEDEFSVERIECSGAGTSVEFVPSPASKETSFRLTQALNQESVIRREIKIHVRYHADGREAVVDYPVAFQAEL